MSQPPNHHSPDDPFSAQPYPGPPAPGNPDATAVYPSQPAPFGEVQPGYPAGGYQQAAGSPYGDSSGGYGPPPGHPQPGAPMPGGFPPVPPKKKSKVLPIVLVSLAVLLVLCIGGVVATVFAAKKSLDEAERAGSTTSPPAKPSATAEAKPDRAVTLVAPAKLNKRPKLTDPQYADTADSMRKGLAEAPGATNSISAVYGDPAKRNMVLVAAVAAPVANPQQELDGTLFGLGTGGLKLTGLKEVEAGPLGGVAKCGNTKSSDLKMAVCAWADDDSLGWFIWYFKSAKQVTPEFVKLRGQVEKVA